jgi:REP element-mobilizing transposase RayT
MGGMARQPRIEMKDGVHHVFARGNDRRTIYLDDVDRHEYLRLLGRVVPWKRWRCLTFCLMDNHLHLLVETPEPNLGSGMQWLHGRFAHFFNERHGRSGHVFQGRFGSVLIKTDAHLWSVVRYIARNPVDAGLCAEAAGWHWSSHAALSGCGSVPGWLDRDRLFEYYAAYGGDPQRRYLLAVEDR